jgi:aminoglycoside/choline kinase family phosphotransferase
VTSSTERQTALRHFVQSALQRTDIELSSASADASFRSYWRVASGAMAPHAEATLVVMDAPPGKEDLGPWLDIDSRLRQAGLHAPEILAVDRDRGFVLMEDLGTRTYLPELTVQSVDTLYADAFDALLRMQTSVDVADLPDYGRQRLVDEMELMPAWFLERHLDHPVSSGEQDVIATAFSALADAAAEQPRAFVHRDFHSRNLLIAEHQGADADSHMLVNPAIVDFQDAVVGPITYDLVSLLRDCYIEWDPKRVAGWVEAYRIRLRAAHLLGPEVGEAQMARWFDLIGLQRHIKVLGIFCRLWYRDGKVQYLKDLPLVWRYTISVAQRYPETGELADLLERALGDSDISTPRVVAAG